MRARVVMYNPKTDMVLLIHRIKNKRDYWVIPGGGSQKGETPLETAIREVEEELMIKLLSPNLHRLCTIDEEGERQVIFGSAIDLTQTPTIHSEEKERASSDNVYEPRWIRRADLAHLNLMPTLAASPIISAIDQDFFGKKIKNNLD